MKEEVKEHKNSTCLNKGCNKEFTKHEATTDLIKQVVNDLCEVVAYTYGPDGNTVIIHNDDGKPYATKDGVSVAKAFYYDCEFKNAIARLIKQAAEETLDIAGDGTTTSTILIGSLINKGLELLESGVSIREVRKQLNLLEDEVLTNLLALKKDIDNENDVYQISLVSSNNDSKIASIVSEAFKHAKNVGVEKANSLEDSLDIINGMKIQTTYHDSAFINKPESRSIEYKDAKIIIIDGKLNTVGSISNILPSSKKPTIIIAEAINEQAMQILKHNHNIGSVSLGLVKSPGIGEHRKNLLQDIAVYTGASVLEEGKTYHDPNVMGSMDLVEVDRQHMIIYKSEFSEKEGKAIESRIEELKSFKKVAATEYEKELCDQRIEILEGKSSIIKVGGESALEIDEKFDRVDDSVRAVGCAIDEGIVLGGGVSLVEASKELNNPFKLCLYEPYFRIFNTRELSSIEKDKKSLENERVIDPYKVTRTALQNAISIANVILSTRAIIINRNQWSI